MFLPSEKYEYSSLEREIGSRYFVRYRRSSRERKRKIHLSRAISSRGYSTFYDSRTPVSPQPLLKRRNSSLSLSPVHFSREYLGHLARAIKNERLSRGVAGGRVGAHELPLINQLSPRHFPLTSLAFPPNRKRGNGRGLSADERRERERIIKGGGTIFSLSSRERTFPANIIVSWRNENDR